MNCDQALELLERILKLPNIEVTRDATEKQGGETVYNYYVRGFPHGHMIAHLRTRHSFDPSLWIVGHYDGQEKALHRATNLMSDWQGRSIRRQEQMAADWLKKQLQTEPA